MPRHYTSLLTHVVFATQSRRPQIQPGISHRLNEYISGIIRDDIGRPIITNSVADQVHSLFEIRPTVAIADAMRVIKANSSKWLHQDLKIQFGWQAGYGAFAVSRSNVDAVYRYIARQQEHHQKQTFEGEFRELLERHGVVFDERYLFP